MKLITEDACVPENFTGIAENNGNKVWYKNCKLHREDGPACEYSNGSKFWFLNGIEYSEQEFNEKMNPTPTCNGKVVTIDGKKYKLTEIQNNPILLITGDKITVDGKTYTADELKQMATELWNFIAQSRL